MLALGIGLTVAMFTLVERVLLRPAAVSPRGAAGDALRPRFRRHRHPDVSSADWQDWRAGARALESTAIYGISQRLTVPIADSAMRLTAENVSGDFFHVLQSRFVAGRPFTTDEVQSRALVVVVSERFWREPCSVPIGRLTKALAIGGRHYTVIGVVATAAAFPDGTDLWLPVAMTAESGGMRNNINWTAIARLRCRGDRGDCARRPANGRVCRAPP